MSFIQAKLPPFAARSFARVNTVDLGLCPISFGRGWIDRSLGERCAWATIPPFPALPNAKMWASAPRGFEMACRDPTLLPFRPCSHRRTRQEPGLCFCWCHCCLWRGRVAWFLSASIAGVLTCSFPEGLESSCRCSVFGKCYQTLSFLLLFFILVGSAINPGGWGHKANSDGFKMGAIPSRVLDKSLLCVANNLRCKLEWLGNVHYTSLGVLIFFFFLL